MLSKTRLSDVPEGGVLQYEGQLGIVIERWPEDRTSGGTVVLWEAASARSTYIWEHKNGDPTVLYLGQGKVETKIVFQKETSDAAAASQSE